MEDFSIRVSKISELPKKIDHTIRIIKLKQSSIDEVKNFINGIVAKIINLPLKIDLNLDKDMILLVNANFKVFKWAGYIVLRRKDATN